MNWKNIKTFLILLFTCINLLLIISTINMTKGYTLTEETIENTVTLLEQNNIFIDKKIIPQSAKEHENIHLTSLGLSEDNSIDTSIFSLNNDGTISSKIKINPNEITEKNYEAKIKKILNENNFNTKNIKIYNTGSEKNSYIMTSLYDGLEIFDNNISITVNENNIEFSGNWYTYESEIIYFSQENNVIYSISALAEFISTRPKNDEKITITDISLGYKADTDENTKNVKTITAVPCYRLTTDKGLVYYYNIRNGKFMAE